MSGLTELLTVEEQAAFHEALYRIADRSIRLHVSKRDASLPFQTEPIPWHPLGRWLTDSSVRPGALLNYAAAQYYIKDAASMIALALLDPRTGESICDLCAAPGGKASAISEQIGPTGLLFANETIRSRIDVLQYALARAGQANYVVGTYDPDDLSICMSTKFDAVLVDAPCSGQTLVGKKKRDDNAFDTKQIEHCAARQKRILESAARLVRPGGRLIYSTCTFAIEENEEQIRWLCDQYPGCWSPIINPALEPWQSPLMQGCYRLWPHRDRCAGGFAAGLTLIEPITFQSSSDSNTTRKPSKHQGRTKGSSQRVGKQERQLQATCEEVFESIGTLRGVCLNADGQRGYVESDAVRSFQNENPEVEAMKPMVMLLVGKRYVPTHGLAMMDRTMFVPHHHVELNDSAAMSYVHGESIAVAVNDSSRQWIVANWNGRPLGWCHTAGNRLNNHLPVWARMT